MKPIFAFCLLAAAACAQNPQPAGKPLGPAPAKVDKALRARIAEFYQDQVTGKFREGEALVAEDTKDLYYSSSHTQILGFEIKSISYFDKYKRATAQMTSQRNIMMEGFMGHPVTTPFASTWKIERGKWVWYMDKEVLRQTAFGIKLPESVLAAPPNTGAQPPIAGFGALGLTGKVSVDRSALTIKPGESAEIVFTSSAPGVAVVSIEGNPAGLTISPAQVFVKQNESAKVTVKALPAAATAALRFRVDPSGESIGVTVSVSK